MAIKVNCFLCGNEFSTFSSLLKRGRKFCSRICYEEHWKNNIHPNMEANIFKTGDVPWNKGLKNVWSDKHIDAIKEANTGRIPWNKNTNIQTNTGRTHFKSGRKSDRKGKTWEEIYDEKTIKYMRKRDRESTIKQLKEGKIGKCDTLPERIVENYLLFNDILHLKQYPYKFGVADFWLPESNVIIEVDGDYWHSLPGYKERDEKQTKWLEDNNYTVYRFKESEIKTSVDECLDNFIYEVNKNGKSIRKTISSI